MSIELHFHKDLNQYRSSCGLLMAREKDTLTPNGNPMNDRWALRTATGDLIDFDRYRFDLADRHDIKLIGSEN